MLPLALFPWDAKPMHAIRCFLGVVFFFFSIKTLCSSFGPGWDGNFRHAREEDSRGQADKCHDGLAKEIQLSYEHVGRFSPGGNFLHEVQLRLGTTSDFQAITPKAKPTPLCSPLCSQVCKSKSGPKGVRKPRVSHLAEIHCAALMLHPIFSFCSGGRRMRGECLGWWDKDRHSGGGTKSNWDASPLPGQVERGQSPAETFTCCQKPCRNPHLLPKPGRKPHLLP